MEFDGSTNSGQGGMDDLHFDDLPLGDDDIKDRLDRLAESVINLQHADCSDEFSSSGSSTTSTPHGTPVMAPRKDAGRCTSVDEEKAVQRARDNAAKRQAERSNGKGRRAGGGKGACPSAVKDKRGGKRPRMIPDPPPPEPAQKKKKKCAMMDRDDIEYQPPPAKKAKKIRVEVQRPEAIPAAAAANDVNAAHCLEAAKCKYCKCVPVFARTCFWGSCILCKECAEHIDTSGGKCPCGCQYKGSDAVADCIGDLFEANRVLDIPTCEHCKTTEFENLAFKQHVDTCERRPYQCHHCDLMTDQLHQCKNLPCARGKCEHKGYKHSKEPCTTRELYNTQQQQAKQIAEQAQAAREQDQEIERLKAQLKLAQESLGSA